VACVVAIVAMSIQTYAFIPPQDRCIDVKSIVQVQPLNDSLVTKEMVATYMPTNMTPGTDPNLFANQFTAGLGQRISDKLMKSDFFRHSSIGRVANDIEKATKQSFVYIPDRGVTQKIDFKVKAIERTAEVAYEGYFKSTVTYIADQNNVVFVISKNLNPTTVLSLTNTSPMGQFNQSGMMVLTHTF
jgi:hypothetical protein